MTNKWFENFLKFLLDLAKVVFTTLIIGKMLTPSVDWRMFIAGIILALVFILISYCIARAYKNKD